MKKELSHIAFVIDRSGSMEVMAREAIGGFNSFIEDQKKVKGKAVLTLAQFDHEYEIVHDGVDLKEVPPLNSKTYVPRGTTALLDAIGRTIISVGNNLEKMPEKSRPEHVIFVILTDGYENASKEFNNAKIREMIEHQQSKYSWKFLFLGANMDAFAEAHKMGIDLKFAANYPQSPGGICMAYKGSSNYVSALRSCSASDVPVASLSDYVNDADDDSSKYSSKN